MRRPPLHAYAPATARPRRSFCSTSTRVTSTRASPGRRPSRPPTTAGRSSSSRPPTASRTSRPARATSSTTSGSTPRRTGSRRSSCPGICTRSATRTGTRRNARALPAADRAEQFPRTPEDAFINTGRVLVRPRSLAWYSENTTARGQTRVCASSSTKPARRRRSITRAKAGSASTRSRTRPTPTRSAPTSRPGAGFDYSCAYVIDLTSMAIVAEFHGKIDADEFAEQLHYLGRWYGTARIAIEMGGGFGEPVIISLRDGRKGRPHYPKLYRHAIADRSDMHQLANYGFPMNTKTRPQVINQIEQAIREKHDPGAAAQPDHGASAPSSGRRRLPSPARAGGLERRPRDGVRASRLRCTASTARHAKRARARRRQTHATREKRRVAWQQRVARMSSSNERADRDASTWSEHRSYESDVDLTLRRQLSRSSPVPDCARVAVVGRKCMSMMDFASALGGAGGGGAPPDAGAAPHRRPRRSTRSGGSTARGSRHGQRDLRDLARRARRRRGGAARLHPDGSRRRRPGGRGAVPAERAQAEGREPGLARQRRPEQPEAGAGRGRARRGPGRPGRGSGPGRGWLRSGRDRPLRRLEVKRTPSSWSSRRSRTARARYHDAFVEKVERRYDAYRGLARQASTHGRPSEDWHSNVTTPYVLQTCEGMLATMLEPKPRFNVQPRPKPDEPLDEVIARVRSVDAIGDTLRYALDRDHFAEKQRDFMQQDMIAGISVLEGLLADRAPRRHRSSCPSRSRSTTRTGRCSTRSTSHREETVEDALVDRRRPLRGASTSATSSGPRRPRRSRRPST